MPHVEIVWWLLGCRGDLVVMMRLLMPMVMRNIMGEARPQLHELANLIFSRQGGRFMEVSSYTRSISNSSSRFAHYGQMSHRSFLVAGLHKMPQTNKAKEHDGAARATWKAIVRFGQCSGHIQ